jgi:hypothetical protein
MMKSNNAKCRSQTHRINKCDRATSNWLHKKYETNQVGRDAICLKCLCKALRFVGLELGQQGHVNVRYHLSKYTTR